MLIFYTIYIMTFILNIAQKYSTSTSTKNQLGWKVLQMTLMLSNAIAYISRWALSPKGPSYCMYPCVSCFYYTELVCLWLLERCVYVCVEVSFSSRHWISRCLIPTCPQDISHAACSLPCPRLIRSRDIRSIALVCVCASHWPFEKSMALY